LFIWIDKAIQVEVIKAMEKQKFYLVEKLYWVMMEEGSPNVQDPDAEQFVKKESQYYRSSFKGLFIFRKRST